MSEKTLIDYLESGGKLSLGFDGYIHKTIFCNDLSCNHCPACEKDTCKYWDSRKEISDITATDEIVDRIKKSRPELFI